MAKQTGVKVVLQTGLKFAKNYYSCSLQEPVKLRHFEDKNTERKIKTIPQFFHEHCEKYKNLPALAYESSKGNNGKTKWCTITYGEYGKRVEQTALMLLHLGVPARSSVAILAFNCPEWFYVEMATFRIGAVVAGIYCSNSAEAVHHVLETSDYSVCVVDDAQQMSKVRGCKTRLPKLKAVIQLNGPYENYVDRETGYYKWQDLFDRKYDRSLREELLLRESQVAANECAMLLFTSGTTGLSKGAMVSHDNILYSSQSLSKLLPPLPPKQQQIAITYLPLNHIAAQSFDVFVGIEKGCLIYFADRNALKGSLFNIYQQAKPTMLMGVPRVYEKLQERIINLKINPTKSLHL